MLALLVASALFGAVDATASDLDVGPLRFSFLIAAGATLPLLAFGNVAERASSLPHMSKREIGVTDYRTLQSAFAEHGYVASDDLAMALHIAGSLGRHLFARDERPVEEIVLVEHGHTAIQRFIRLLRAAGATSCSPNRRRRCSRPAGRR